MERFLVEVASRKSSCLMGTGMASLQQALSGSSESIPSGRVRGAEYMIEFPDRKWNTCRIVSTEMMAQGLERARQILLDYVDVNGEPPPSGSLFKF